MNFTKLFNTILDSTIWAESAETKIVWITMLAMADRNGEVHASIPGLANRARVTLDQCEEALDAFLSPDKYSRSKEFEGRRIKEIEGGWALLNHGKYRALLSTEERKEYNRRKQAEYRAQKRDKSNMSMTVDDKSTKCTHTEAEAEAEAEENNPPKSPKGEFVLDDLEKPERKKKLTPAQKQRQRVKANTPQMTAIGRCLGRRPETLWSLSEAEALAMVNPSEDEINTMFAFYNAEIPKESDYRRRTIETLLNNWNGELDKARAWKNQS